MFSFVTFVFTRISSIYTSTGWLPPLLHRIKTNSSNVVVPIVDDIDEETFALNASTKPLKVSDINVGGFSWNLELNWHKVPERDQYLVGNRVHWPIRYVLLCDIYF